MQSILATVATLTGRRPACQLRIFLWSWRGPQAKQTAWRSGSGTGPRVGAKMRKQPEYPRCLVNKLIALEGVFILSLRARRS